MQGESIAGAFEEARNKKTDLLFVDLQDFLLHITPLLKMEKVIAGETFCPSNLQQKFGFWFLKTAISVKYQL